MSAAAESAAVLPPSDRHCRVVERQELGGDAWRLDVEWPALAAAARPAEFAMLRCSPDLTPLLRRPFSVADVDTERGTVSFLGRRVGPGTRALGALGPGDRLPVLAPLGRGFTWREGQGLLHLLVAGGIGIAPFPLLARRLAAAGESVLLLFGGRTTEDLIAVDRFEALGVEVRTIVQKGGKGPTGLVTDLLEDVLRDTGDPATFRAYSCGPTPMLAAVGSRLAEAGVPHQTALEEYMGCGFGVCIGCAVPVHDEHGGVAYERCCVEGPVFDFTRLAW